MTRRHPNLLFVMTDEQKASALGVYGNPLVRTPALERLAHEGALFERAYIQYPLCVPSRASIFTGRPPRDHGIWTNGPRLDPSIPHLFGILREAGYRQALVGKNHYLYDEVLPSVFDMVDEADHGGMANPTTPEVATVNAWLRQPRLLWGPWGVDTNPFPPEQCPPSLLSDAALRFLREARDTPVPFCLWLSYPDPHTPNQAPEAYVERYQAQAVGVPRVETPDELEAKPLRQRIARRMFASEDVPEELVRRSIGTYYALETFIDDQLGRVLRYLDESGLSEETLVVYTSDHGTYLGEHGMPRKSMAFYDCLLHVPLVLRWPGRVAAQRIGRSVSMLDLLPTILDLLGVARPEGLMQPALLADRPEEPVVYAEAGVPETRPPGWDELSDVPEHPLDGRFFPWGGRPAAWFGPARMVRTEAAKLVRYDTGETEVYDLRADPGELVNLADRPEGRELARDLDHLLQRYAAGE